MCDVGKGVTRMLTPSAKQTEFVRAVGETLISPLASAGVFTPTGNREFAPAYPRPVPAVGPYPPEEGGDMVPILIIAAAAVGGVLLLMR